MTTQSVSTTAGDAIPQIDWQSAEFHSGIDRAVAAIADHQRGPGIVRSQRGIEVVAYEAAAEIVKNTDFTLGMAARLDSRGVAGAATRGAFLNFLFSRDGQEHLRARKACAPWFASSSAERVRGHVREWLDSWLDDAASQSTDYDFLGGIANRLPSTLFCLLLGAPLTDAPLVAHLSQECMLTSAPPQPDHPDRLEIAATLTTAYLVGLTELRRQQPGDDLLSFLVAAQDCGEIDLDDILAVVFNALVGSTDTTSAQICCNVEALAAHPGQWQLLQQEPDRIPHAVAELMRYNPGAWSITRSSRTATTYKGLDITPDDIVFPDIFAANNDPAVFEDPRRLDITRPHPKPPLNFGAGIHGCLGRMFSLLEQEEVLRAMLRRWDSYEVLEAEFSGAMFFLVPQKLRVSFTATSAQS